MRELAVAEGRHLAVDDLGEGSPVLYLHGTPDSRLARHPDDGIPADVGVRLLAPDRPGIGHSSPDPAAVPRSVADDLVALLDELDVDRVGVLAWSAGSLFALALAGAHPDRVRRVVLASPLVPADAYDDPSALAGSDESRTMFASMVGTMSAEDLAAELAMFLAVPHCDSDTASDVIAESLAAVESIPRAATRLVDAYVDATRQGLLGIERDLVAQATPLGPLLDAIGAPVSIHSGTADTVTPPAMARWLAERLDADLTIHDGAAHSLAIHRWEELVVEAGRV